MQVAQDVFQKAVSDFLEVVIFESWLRFYFIEEMPDGENLEIRLPEKSLERIRELYPSLYPLAQKMNCKPVDFEISRRAVLTHIIDELDGASLPKGEAGQILQSSEFQTRLNLFHVWEQLHEDQLDQGFIEFGAWQNLFAKWLQSPGARELAKKLQ